MTRIVYEPAAPELCFTGHAGAGEAGKDLVCAALSMLMHTLLAALPAGETERELREGFCRVRGGERSAYEVVTAGLRLLAAEYPAQVSLEVRS